MGEEVSDIGIDHLGSPLTDMPDPPLHSFIMRTIVLVLVLFPLLVSAQPWCPPGATWNYRVMAFMLHGSIERMYVGDTMIDGWSAQMIHEAGVIVNSWTSVPTAIDNYRYTSLQDSVLFLWNANGSTDGWDTLFRFNATIGDRWYPPGADEFCPFKYGGMIEVRDTGTFLADGIPLHNWTLAYLGPGGQPNGDFEVVERLGPMGGLEIMPGGCGITEYGELLTCYRDMEIGYIDETWPNACPNALDINSDDHPYAVLPAPNPGTTYFSLTLPLGPHTISLFDATGRLLLQQRTTDARPLINTEVLPAGLYRVTVRDDHGGMTGTTWVKE